MLRIDFSNVFKKSYKKLNKKDKELFAAISLKLANNEILEPKFKDHALKGNYTGFRECHLKTDLLLVYRKRDDVLELYLIFYTLF